MANNQHDLNDFSTAAPGNSPVYVTFPVLAPNEPKASAPPENDAPVAISRPPWLDAFISFYRERFGELLVLPESGASKPTIADLPELHEQACSTAPIEGHSSSLPVGPGTSTEAISATVEVSQSTVSLPADIQEALPWTEHVSPHPSAAPAGQFQAEPTPTHAPPLGSQRDGTPASLAQTPACELGANEISRPSARERSPRVYLRWMLVVFVGLFAGATLFLLRPHLQVPSASHPALAASVSLPSPSVPTVTDALVRDSRKVNVAPTPSAGPVELTGIQHSSTAESTTVAMELSGAAAYTVNRLANPQRIFIDFSHTQPTPALNGRAHTLNEPCLQRYRLAARSLEVTRVTFETGPFCDYSATLAHNPDHLVIVLHPHQFSP